MAKKLTNDEFLRKLSDNGIIFKPCEEYKGSKEKMIFKCDIHGGFLARPNDILNGQGCPKCGGTQKLTNEEFIANANIVHNSFFSYDKCIYVNSNEKVTITCPIHGDFEQKPNNHLNGQGCLKCKLEGIKHKITMREQVNKSTRSISDAVFKERYYNKFGHAYDLSDTEYVNNRTIFYPLCKIHGKFPITPNHLIMGRGCPKCAKNYHYTKEELVEKFKEIHGCNFLYDMVKEAKTHEMVEIGCKTHGYFTQMVSNHLKGQGCPLCKESKMEKEITELLAKKEIEFEREKRFDWLGRQSLDFYLPKHNVVIECQGIQHFEPLDYFGGKEEFERRKMLDSTKSERCKENGIEMIYYADYDYDFPYEVIKDKNKLLSIILEKK